MGQFLAPTLTSTSRSTITLNASELVYDTTLNRFFGGDGTTVGGFSIGSILGSGTANQITYFTASGTIASLSTTTYPSLTELSYVKGVTSAIQTQLNGKQASSSSLTSLAGLTYVSTSFVKMTAAGTFSLDTATYLTGNQTITLSGDISGSGTTSITTTIGANKVTNSMLAQMSTATFKGRTTAGTGNVEDLTATQATALLNTFSSTLKGLTPASGGGTTNFLRADGTWAAPPGGSGSGIKTGTASGTGTYISTISGVSAYTDGDAYIIKFTNTNNGTPSTLNINSLGAIQICTDDVGTLIPQYQIVSNAECLLIYNSSLNKFKIHAAGNYLSIKDSSFGGLNRSYGNARIGTNDSSVDKTLTITVYNEDAIKITTDVSQGPTNIDIAPGYTAGFTNTNLSYNGQNFLNLLGTATGFSPSISMFASNGTDNSYLLMSNNIALSSNNGDIVLEVNGAYNIDLSASKIRYVDLNSGYYIGFQLPTLSTSSLYTLPTSVPASNKVLQSDSSGVLTWVTNTGGGGTTTNALTMNNSGSGAASGTTFNGSTAVTLSYNTIGASPLAGSTSLTTLGTVTTGTLSTGAVIGGVTMTLGSDASYDVYYRGATGVLTRLANGTTGQFLGANTGAAPSWQTPSGGGGSMSIGGAVTGGTSGSILFINSSGQLAQDNANLFFDATNDRVGIAQSTPLSRLHINTNQNSVTQSDANGILLANSTVAISGTQSISPAIVIQGNGYATTPAASQDVRFRMDVLPTQGAGNPTATWRLLSNINNAGYSNQLSYTSGGVLSLNNVISVSGGTGLINAGSQLTCGASSTSTATYRTTSAGSPITPLFISGQFTVLTAGTPSINYDATNQLTFSASNGTNQIARAAIQIVSLTNTAGAETGDLAFYTKASGAAIAEAMRIFANGNVIIGGTSNSGYKLDVAGQTRLQFDVTISDTRNFIFSTSSGTRFGTATGQKISFWNKTPIIQPTTSTTAATFVANTSLIANDTATYGGYTIGQIAAALINMGILA